MGGKVEERYVGRCQQEVMERRGRYIEMYCMCE